MLKIAINGIFGRMGQELTSVVEENDAFELIGGIDVKEGKTYSGKPVSIKNDIILSKADVVIDFSLPEGAIKVLETCLKHKKPLVTGTTGFDNSQLENFKKASQTIPIVQAFNFSIGVNLLSQLISQAAELLKDKADIERVETHHRYKKDSASGKVVHLAKVIVDNLNI